MHKDRGAFTDWYAAMLSVQQENGKIILYCVIFAIFDFVMALIVSRFPSESVYLVPGVSSVQQTTLYWNFDDASIQRILANTSFAPRKTDAATDAKPSPSPANPEPAPVNHER